MIAEAREEKKDTLIDIPEHIRHLSFCKVLKGTKRPFEDEWEKKPYTYVQILPWVRGGNSYGILSGYHNIGTIDNDCKEYLELTLKCLPPTFMVQSSSFDKGTVSIT